MKLIAIILVTAGAAASQSPNEFSDGLIGINIGSNSIFQVSVVPKAGFTLSSMAKTGRQFLNGAGKERTLVTLLMFTDRDIATEESRSCEGGYREWRGFYDRFPKRGWGAAEVISIRGNAVLLFRNPDGTVLREVLSGKDPTRFSFGAITLHILTIEFRGPARIPICGQPGTVDPVVYFETTSTLSTDLCERITGFLAKDLGVKHILVSFRNDSWFQCAPFPIVYPFSQLVQPPSEQAHAVTSEFICGLSCDGTPRCIRLSGSGQ